MSASAPIKTLTPSTIKVIWFALTLSMVIYAVFLFVLTKEGAVQTRGPEADTIRQGMSFFAGTVALVSVFLRRTLLGEPRIHADLAKLNLPQGDPQTAFSAAVRPMAQKWFVANLISWAMNEAVVLSGFVIGMISRDFNAFLPFFLVGIILNLVMRPNLEPLEAGIRKWIENRDIRG
jgi:hypothetical protein